MSEQVVTEWGVRYQDGSVTSCGYMDGLSEQFARSAMTPDQRFVVRREVPVSVVFRERTIFDDALTEWADPDPTADLRAALVRTAGELPRSPHRDRGRVVSGADVEAIEQACAWAEYRKNYGVSASDRTAAHKAFLAGWDAARNGDQSDVQR